jgi:arylsulfatase A-like enzyme
MVMARDGYDDCIAFLDDQLGRLLEMLKVQGLLDKTMVIVTSDHGESFGVHGVLGHGGTLYLDEVGVPLVILAPGAQARVVANPVSLRDLPATVVDELKLSTGSPFAGHSLSAFWRSTRGHSPVETSPAFSEFALPSAFQPQDSTTLTRRGIEMSLVAAGHHYTRDGRGKERIYNLEADPYELTNLSGTASGDHSVMNFRRLLRRFLSDNPGSNAVENAYLKAYRQLLDSIVDESTDRAAILGP